MGSKPVRSVSSWPLLQFLLAGSCPVGVLPSSLSDGMCPESMSFISINPSPIELLLVRILCFTPTGIKCIESHSDIMGLETSLSLEGQLNLYDI